MEPDAAEMRRLIDAAAERVIAHVSSLPEQPADGTEGGLEAARRVRSELPREGKPIDEVLDRLFEDAVPHTFNTASPGYLAYIPGGGLYASAVAAFVADAVNRYVGVFAAAPALAQIEADVVRWFAEMVGYPAAARGFLTSGGSLANLSGVVTARRVRLPDDFLNGTIYTSDQAHHSVLKAALLAGFPAESVRSLPADRYYRLSPERVAEAVREDRAAGRRPFLLVASAGTTNTGAVDPLSDLADLAAREELWFHVDASYGGLFALTGRGRSFLRGLERADSLVLDPHKSFFLPYGSGCLLVRDGAALRRAHSVRADYMPQIQDDDEFVDFCEISPELSRGFRGLKVWVPLQLYGIEPFRAALEEKLELSDRVARELRDMPGVEIVAEPQVTVTAWRLAPEGVEGAALDELNRRLLRAINARKRVYLTGTRLPCGFVIRVCVLSHRTHHDRVDAALADIRAAIDEVAP